MCEWASVGLCYMRRGEPDAVATAQPCEWQRAAGSWRRRGCGAQPGARAGASRLPSPLPANALPSCAFLPVCADQPARLPTPPAGCSQKLDGPYDNRVLPVVVTVVLMTFLTIVWIGSIVRWAPCRADSAGKQQLCISSKQRLS